MAIGKILINWENSWKDTSTIDTIESLSIIQKTPSKPSDTKPSDIILIGHHQQKTSTDNTKPKVAESEIIGTNHLGFMKSLFQQYSQQLGLNNNHYSAKSAFNFYVNERITDFLGRPVNIESARENFYSELIQHTNLSRNHSFALIIREINQEIERYTQKTFPITYQDKGKGKLQTPAKKQRIKSPIYPSYHHTPGSTINIASADTSTSTKTLLARIMFQSKQKKNKLLGAYGNYFEGFKSRSPTPSGFQLPPHQPDFGTQNLLPVIIINQPPIEPIGEPIQPSQVPPQQPLPLQQFQQQPPQPLNLDSMAYAPIAKLDNFTSEEDDAQVWLNNDTANSWYQSLINKPQDFDVFKVEFLRYFSNNNSINCLINIFTTMKQGETEAVTTYLGCFHRNLHQIQAINANYFTAPQILNQFICGLRSSILQHVHLLHSGTLQDTVTCAKDFEFAESEANHAQAINLVMNRSSELDSKLEKFSETINKRLEGYLADNHAIYQPPQ
ncbi:hypothetical protein G9A89_005098 [Geosiphon pyriformis]|nr:hypothetical protein G9A89_005098 [Geosiphon pyriformis]